MKNKYFYIIAACALLVAFALGISGSVMLADDDAGAFGQDRLVGLFVTTEYLDLFDFGGYFEDHMGDMINGGEIKGDTSAYEGRLYATLVEKPYVSDTGETVMTRDYVFEGVEGFPYFYAHVTDEQGSYTTAYGDEAVSGGQNAFAYTDEGESVNLEGTIYVAASLAGKTFYFNPVYQAADGSIYATTGNGFSSQGDHSEGELYAQTLSATYSETKNGVTTADSISIKLGIGVLYPPTRICVLQLDAESAVLSAELYAPGNLPESIAPAKGAAYIVVESYKTDAGGNEVVERKLYERGAESIETFYARDDGVCVRQFTALDWENEARPGRT